MADTKKILVNDANDSPALEFEALRKTYPGRYVGLIRSTFVAGVGGGTDDDFSVPDNAGNQNIPLTAITAIKTAAARIF